MIYFLFVYIAIIFILAMYLNKNDITAPGIVFSAGFLFQAFWAVLYAEKWSLNLGFDTLLVIFLGVWEFTIVCILVSKIYGKLHKLPKPTELQEIKISPWKELVTLNIILFITFLFLYFVLDKVGGNAHSIENIMNAISKYDHLSKFSEDFMQFRLPSIISNLRICVIALGYWFLYVVINNFIVTKKIKVLEVLIVFTSIFISILSGSRTNAIFIVICGIFYYVFLNYKKNNYKTKISVKFLVIAGAIFLTLLFTFAPIARLLGRKINYSTFDYLSIYCGAQIKNLDTFMKELPTYVKQVTFFGAQTFRSLIITIGEKIGFEGYHPYQLDLPFRSINGYNLGNVYTTFYPYIYDFGILGEIILVFIMAFISQFVYERAKRSTDNSKPPVSILLYSTIFLSLLFSFFSNKFYENIISMVTVKYIIVWIACDIFFIKIHFSIKEKIKVISGYIKTDKNAGPKAKVDIERIMEEHYNAYILTLSNNKNNKIKALYNKVIFLINAFLKNNIVVVQYPLGKHFVRCIANYKILVVHDVEGLRSQDQNLLKKEIKYFNTFDYVILHNDIMKDYLIKKGLTTKVYTNKLFDYLISKENTNKHSGKKTRVVYAGNLNKSSFYKELDTDNINYQLVLYGDTNDKIKKDNIFYGGSYSPDILPAKLEGTLGLVWDGSLGDEDENSLYKNYTKYNNPHKLSCYIAAKLPVIAWKKSAIANLVKKYDIGYLIDTIDDINNLDLSDYEEKKKNVIKLHDKITEGYYTISVFDEILEDIERVENEKV